MAGESKRINVDKIENMTVAFKDSVEAIPNNVQGEMLDAPARENFEQATSLVRTSMTNLTTTVQSLDVYMDAVARAFRQVDERIAAAIREGTGTDVQPVRK